MDEELDSCGDAPVVEVNLLQARLRGLPVFVRELLSGGVAGGLAKTVVAPLERTKILYQTRGLQGQAVADVITLLWRTEGAPGLYKGNGASVLRVVPYAAVHFGLYDYYKRLMVKHLDLGGNGQRVSPVVDLLAGSFSGASAVLVTYPLDLVRTRLAWATSAAEGNVGPAASTSGREAVPVARYSIHSVMMKTVHEEGVRGLYRGAVPTLLGILPYAGLKFFTYNTLKQWYLGNAAPGPGEGRRDKLPVLATLGFGAVSGLLAQTCTYPLDVVRRKMQVCGMSGQSEAAGTTGRAVPAAIGRAAGVQGLEPLAKANAPTTAGRVAPAAAGGAGLARPPLLLQQHQQGGGGNAAVHVHRTTLQTFRHVWLQSGMRGLFRGLSINYMKVVPSTAIGFTVYDFLKDFMKPE